MKVAEPFLNAARDNDYSAFDMHTIWGHAAQVPLAGNPNPGMWMYGDALARLERLAPGVLYAGLKACNDYVAGFESAAKVKCPALLVIGRRDVMTPLRAAQPLQQRIAGCNVVTLEASGHALMAEAPDATLDALIEFIS
jgi:pimeloyl-ACP methyl ester carboxylesterase